MAEKQRRYKPVILIEKGRQKYTKEKMQGAGIMMEILSHDETLESQIANLPPIRNTQADVSYYLIGSDDFIKRAKAAVCGSGFKGTVSREFSDEDTCMTYLKCSFPKMAQTFVKDTSARQSPLQTELMQMGAGDAPDPDLVAVLLAVEELKNYQISPPTPDNIRKALINRTRIYLQNPDSADAAVEKYLKIVAKARQEK